MLGAAEPPLPREGLLQLVTSCLLHGMQRPARALAEGEGEGEDRGRDEERVLHGALPTTA